MKERKGFTLVELIAVIAILAILALIAVPKFQDVTQTARERAFESNHKVAAGVMTIFAVKYDDQYPTPGDHVELAAMVDKGEGKSGSAFSVFAATPPTTEKVSDNNPFGLNGVPVSSKYTLEALGATTPLKYILKSVYPDHRKAGDSGKWTLTFNPYITKETP